MPNSRPAAWRTHEILIEARDFLVGVTYGKYQGWFTVDSDAAMFSATLQSYIQVIDLFLTGSLRVRDMQTDSVGSAGILFGDVWKVVLSDAESTLIVRLPTKTDHRCIYPDEMTEEVQLRWSLIDIPSDQPVSFPIEEEYLE